MSRLIRYWKSIAWSLLILGLLTIKRVPVDRPELSLPGLDKIVHMGLFFCLSFIVFFDLKDTRLPLRRRYTMIVLLPIIYGGILELVQGYCIVERSGDWFDLLADALGSFACFLILKKGRTQKSSA